MGVADGNVSLALMMSRGRPHRPNETGRPTLDKITPHPPPPSEGLRQLCHMTTIAAMHRALVSCHLVDPDTLQVVASDGTVWLHHVERDDQGRPVPEQINAWLSQIWAPGEVPKESAEAGRLPARC
jgi:hypothetical protein